MSTTTLSHPSTSQDVLVSVASPATSPLAAVDAEVARARRGVRQFTRLAAQAGYRVAEHDLLSPESRCVAIGRLIRNAALAQTGLTESRVTTTFGQNVDREARVDVARFQVAHRGIDITLRRHIVLLGEPAVLAEVVAVTAELVPAGAR